MVITVQAILQEHFEAFAKTHTTADGRLRTMVLPAGVDERRVADLGAFTEWDSELDRAYDVLARE